MTNRIDTEGYCGPDRRESSQMRWHVDRTVSVSHILTTLSMLLAGLWFISQQSERIALNTQAISQNKAQIEAQDNRVSRSLESINDKLDKLQELLIRGSQR